MSRIVAMSSLVLVLGLGIMLAGCKKETTTNTPAKKVTTQPTENAATENAAVDNAGTATTVETPADTTTMEAPKEPETKEAPKDGTSETPDTTPAKGA